MVYKLFRALAGLEAGRTCRSCGEAILAQDAHGLGEGVCKSCRGW
jgi:formylmethanofuran dehydrogenase subunit E